MIVLLMYAISSYAQTSGSVYSCMYNGGKLVGKQEEKLLYIINAYIPCEVILGPANSC